MMRMQSLLAEISDKEPSAAFISVVAVVLAAVCAGAALSTRNRIVGMCLLMIAGLLGGVFSYSAAAESLFISGGMRDAIWTELGWPWALASIGGPLLPAVCVAGVLIFRRAQSDRRGFSGGLPSDSRQLTHGWRGRSRGKSVRTALTLAAWPRLRGDIFREVPRPDRYR